MSKRALDLVEGLAEVRDDFVHLFNAHAEAHEVVGDVPLQPAGTYARSRSGHSPVTVTVIMIFIKANMNR